ncbi:hypothetical protein [Methylobacterium sp. R2-1]|uniref:hypothetical protein n=1 Tax=Methylobacterium sp. R2-1 TaxID=2587064 RepID=UPI0016102DF6|nr:hypothetical protein [Methylobacterium sp. R2-1]MBB2965010.1 hypothetical protein [Methylobacterium sp. R2-1]
MRDTLWVRVRDRKNRYAIMDLAHWIVGQGHAARTKKGFGLVRGSDRDSPDGLKERRDLQEMGLTADKIRGAVEALEDVEFLDVERKGGGASYNYRGQRRNPPNVYRINEHFCDLFKRGVEEMKRLAKILPQAASAVARELLSGINSTLLTRKTLESAPPNCPSKDRSPIMGEFGTSTPQKGHEPPQEAPGRPSLVSLGHPPVTPAAPADGPPVERAPGPMDRFLDELQARLGLPPRKADG